ncbi:hypothetical protein [Haloglomus litoreum]|uniref:hypothetical protein n=1 Tax=Haloglomus litoreum TaxID=3034026 RepID=UPI0023E8BB49|nr:hypothetical protein [Haloglomus sp. DT116]
MLLEALAQDGAILGIMAVLILYCLAEGLRPQAAIVWGFGGALLLFYVVLPHEPFNLPFLRAKPVFEEFVVLAGIVAIIGGLLGLPGLFQASRDGDPSDSASPVEAEVGQLAELASRLASIIENALSGGVTLFELVFKKHQHFGNREPGVYDAQVAAYTILSIVGLSVLGSVLFLNP